MKFNNRLLVAVISIVFVALLAFVAYTGVRVASADRVATELRHANQTVQKELELAANAADASEKELQRMQFERAQLAAINQHYEFKVAAITKQNADLVDEITKLGLSKDETVIHWTNGVLPDHVVRVLKHQSSTDSGANEDSNDTTTKQHATDGLQTSSV